MGQEWGFGPSSKHSDYWITLSKFAVKTNCCCGNMNYADIPFYVSILVLVKYWLNLQKYLLLDKAFHKFYLFSLGKARDATTEDKITADEAGLWFESNMVEIKKLILACGIGDVTHTYMMSLSGMAYKEAKIFVLDNMLMEEVFDGSRSLINRARGFYKGQALKSFNPIYWIETMIFLPRKVFEFFGVSKESSLTNTLIKFLQIFYWIGMLLFTYLNYIKKGN